MGNKELKQNRRNLRIPTGLSYKIFMWIGMHQDEGITYQSSIAKELKIPPTTLNYHYTKFKGGGLLTSNLHLTEQGLKLFKYLFDNYDKKIIRCHNIQVVINVRQCCTRLNPNIIYTPFSNKKYKGFKSKINGFTFMFYSPYKVVAVLPDIYADNDEEISSEIQSCIKDIKFILENDFKMTLGSVELATIQRMHIAVLNSNIAKNFLLNGFTEENTQFSIDNSNGVPEIELTNPETALRDIMKLVKLDQEVKNGN